MPRDPKAYEDEEQEQDLRDAPQVDEEEVEEDERALASLNNQKGDKHSEYGDDDEDLAEDIDLDDLAAMEGPDA